MKRAEETEYSIGLLLMLGMVGVIVAALVIAITQR